jgi:hypothetical protein
MKEIIKKHPLRDIVLSFDLDKEPLEFEQIGLKAYYKLHDETWEWREKLIAHQANFKQIRDEMDDQLLDLIPIEQNLDFIDASLGLFDEADLPDFEGEVNFDVGLLIQGVTECNTVLHSVRDRLNAELDWYNTIITYEHQNDGWTDAADFGRVAQIYKRFEEASVDIVFLDKDEDLFRCTYQTVRELEQQHIEFAKQTIATYDVLLKKYDQARFRTERMWGLIP